MNIIDKRIIEILNDGKCHSGGRLAKSLNVSRSAIWKHIHELIKQGLPIHIYPNTGYQLGFPIIFLDETVIKDSISNKFNVVIFDELVSTNTFIKTFPVSHKIDIVLAEIQSGGHGRFGRHWFSPLAQNIYFSARWPLPCAIQMLGGFSLVIGLAVLKTVQSVLPDGLSIKWPNDIYYEDKKLAGILIDIHASDHTSLQVIIGIGINVNSREFPDLGKPVTSLSQITGYPINRNQLVSTLIQTLDEYINRFLQKGFADFMSLWQKWDYLYGKTIEILTPQANIQGVVEGVQQDGQLLLKIADGSVLSINMGESVVLK